MSDQQSPVALESSKPEAVEEPSSKAEPNTVINGQQLWRDIKAQTGFDSYQDYIKTYMDREDRHDLRVLQRWIDEHNPSFPDDGCSIVDVLAHEDSPPTLSTRCQVSGYQLLAALRQPPEHVCAQIVIWPTGPYFSETMGNIFGLGLRIGPQFFLALMETLKGPGQSNPLNAAIEIRPLRPSHVVIDRTVATFVRHYPFDKPAAAPIVLIAGSVHWLWIESPASPRDLACVADQRINNSPPFTNPRHHGDLASRPNFRNPNLEWLHIYGGVFSVLGGHNPDVTSCAAAIIAGILMPLLQIDCLKIRAQFLRLRRTFLELQAAMSRDSVDHQVVNHTSSKLHQQRFWLRRSVEDSDDGVIHFEKYISAGDANYLPESAAYLNVKQEMGQVKNEARRLDAEVRDYLQLEVGNLSLEESRKSIELSNHQILEGKRVKIFTILAFVYIPLNLATSIFGMNLQQLNQSGQNLWVFIVTGVVALLITGVSWFCVEVITSFKGWTEPGSTNESRRNQSMVFRLALLVWLVKNGHTTWMWQSGAWLCILSNDKLGKFRAREKTNFSTEYPPEIAVAEGLPEKACDYVSRSITGELWPNFWLRTIGR